MILNILLNENDNKCEKNELVKKVKGQEEEIIKNSKKEECLKFSDEESIIIQMVD